MAAGNGSALIVYPDTSLLIAALVEEPGSERADAWLTELAAHLALSGWLEVELASALAAKERRRGITREQLAAALAVYRQQLKPSASWLTVTDRALARATSMVEAAPGLRGGDALHLSMAEIQDALLVTLDRQQAELGSGLGVKTQLI